MATCTKIFILCYLLLYPHYLIAFDHVTIVNEDTIDKEFDNNIYQKNLFQPTSYLNTGYGTLYEHIGTVYQNVHTHYLIVGIKIPTHKDIPVPPQNATRTCFFECNVMCNVFYSIVFIAIFSGTNNKYCRVYTFIVDLIVVCCTVVQCRICSC